MAAETLMSPRIELIPPKLLIGRRLQNSFANDKTSDLFRGFMPRRKEISGRLSENIFCLQMYGSDFDFTRFDPTKTFEKWAAVEVAGLDSIPEGLESFILPAGLYAVFLHKGGPATGPETFRYIFGTWLPASDYELDDRPHFEILDGRYRNGAPESEEDIYIPIKVRRPGQ